MTHGTAADRRRDLMGWGLAALNRVGGAPVIDRLGLRREVERAVFQATRSGFTAAGAASRAFARRSAGPSAAVRAPSSSRTELFDLTPSDEQQQIVSAVRDFAARELRPAASDADAACTAPRGLLRTAATDLGTGLLAVPEELGGAASERGSVTNVLVAEALAHGDMGLAVAILAPTAVATALSLWGDAGQQQAYLPAFVNEQDERLDAALAVLEPHALFDPFALRTTARKTARGYVLDGVKSLVPLAASAELFLVAAAVPVAEGVQEPALFLVESSTPGVSIEAEPAMGLRAASLGRVLLDGVEVGQDAVLGSGDRADRARVYAECIRLSRLAWAALAVGTAQAVLDYVIPYVNSRTAFGEPISHRQAVAFLVADAAIELEGMRLATRRAAARAERGELTARDAAVARRLSAEYGMKIGTDGVQLLGGHGFVKEHPVERWYRDLRAVGLMEGAVLV